MSRIRVTPQNHLEVGQSSILVEALTHEEPDVEFRVKPVTRYIVTRCQTGGNQVNPMPRQIGGEHSQYHVAYEIAHALASEVVSSVSRRAIGRGYQPSAAALEEAATISGVISDRQGIDELRTALMKTPEARTALRFLDRLEAAASGPIGRGSCEAEPPVE